MAMPALSAAERVEEALLLLSLPPEEEVEVAVLLDEEDEEDEEPELKSAAVTLKQGIWAEKVEVWTKVCLSSRVRGGARMEEGKRDTYDVSAGVEGLVAAVVVAGPVFELDGGVGAGGGGVGEGRELVALVAGLDGGDVADDLGGEVGLAGGVWPAGRS